ncbi:MAG: DUF1385 domain-containing protein [Clostridiales bacterium]|nr:DUF1385 domain-containing protein [Clostridiales bacterium]
MRIAEARSYSNGIDFALTEKNYLISVTRDENGKINVSREGRKLKEKRDIKNYLLIYFSLLVFTIIYINLPKTNNKLLNMIEIFAFVWGVVFAYYFVNSKNKNNASKYRYHAAEHKMLNYLERYNEVPNNCDDVMKMNSISLSCGSTWITVILFVITIGAIGCSIIPWLLLKILWCIFCIIISLYLWANDKLNFFQKMILKEPTNYEIEVAIAGIKEYEKILNEQIIRI